MLLTKRLESSWFSFYKTVSTIFKRHTELLDNINAYIKNKKDSHIRFKDSNFWNQFSEEDNEDSIEDFTIGSREIPISEIERAGKLDSFKKDLKTDIDKLEKLVSNLKRLSEKVENELSNHNLYKSNDDKLERLMNVILNKQKNNQNQKIIIFTVYKDTAVYLYEQLVSRKFDRIGLVAGDDCRTNYGYISKKFEPILQSFAPYTKLFLEKNWSEFSIDKSIPLSENYKLWKDWIYSKNIKEVIDRLEKPIEILISTDVLSEGQNLQDCDTVVNYDIHWNPVRVLQRFGRIDRLGSPNDTIHCINFWPSKDINEYLLLEKRIEDKMVAMKLSGVELPSDFTQTLNQRIEDEHFDTRQKDKMLKQMEITIDDIDLQEETLGLDDFTLKEFRDDLLSELNKNRKKYEEIPNSVFTGFKVLQGIKNKSGLIALIGYPNKEPKTKNWKYKDLRVIHIDLEGKDISKNERDTLRFLKYHKQEKRLLPEGMNDTIDTLLVHKYSSALKNWFSSQYAQESKTSTGETIQTAGSSTVDLLKGLKSGNKDALQRIQENVMEEEKYTIDKFDLITWFIVQG
jgi:superfamily II DNA/RNA helicase